MPAPKPADAVGEWLAKPAAAKLLGASLRQLERRERQGYIEKRVTPRGPMERAARVLYSRADIIALKAGTPNSYARVAPVKEPAPRAAKPTVVSNDTGAALAVVDHSTEIFAALLGKLATVFPTPTPSAEPPRPWLTLDEAVEYSGLPRAFLLAEARAGSSPFALNVGTTGRGARYRFNRDALANPGGA